MVAKLLSKTKLWISKINFCAKLHSKKELWRLKTLLFCETSFKMETLMLKNEAFLRHFLQKWSVEAQKRSFCARFPSKTQLWKSKTKLFCETSFKNDALKLKNEAFARDFLQKRSFEAQKGSFCARLPSKMKLWRSKTKLLCETSFKNEALKLKNEAFVRDFLPKWNFEHQKRSISAKLPSKMTCWPHAWPQNYNTFCQFSSSCFKSIAPATKKLSRGIRSPVTTTRNDHCKVTFPWHEICNPSTDSASETSTIDIVKHEILAPATRNASFPSLFKATTLANVFATLTNSCACHAFWNVLKSLRLPRQKHFEPQKVVRDPSVLTILTSKSFSCAGVIQILATSTSKSAPRLLIFNDFDFQIVLARRRGANFSRLQLPKVLSHRQFFIDFDFQIVLVRRRGVNFGDFNFQKCSDAVSF